MATSERVDAVVLQVARFHLHLTDLTTRGSNSLDLHEFSVESLKRALTAAFAGGYAVAQDEMRNQRE